MAIGRASHVQWKEIVLSGKKPYMHLARVGDELIVHDRYRCKILNQSQFDSGQQSSGQQLHKQLTNLIDRQDVVYLSVQQ